MDEATWIALARNENGERIGMLLSDSFRALRSFCTKIGVMIIGVIVVGAVVEIHETYKERDRLHDENQKLWQEYLERGKGEAPDGISAGL